MSPAQDDVPDKIQIILECLRKRFHDVKPICLRSPYNQIGFGETGEEVVRHCMSEGLTAHQDTQPATTLPIDR